LQNEFKKWIYKKRQFAFTLEIFPASSIDRSMHRLMQIYVFQVVTDVVLWRVTITAQVAYLAARELED
jgi:hypothetical protein